MKITSWVCLPLMIMALFGCESTSKDDATATDYASSASSIQEILAVGSSSSEKSSSVSSVAVVVEQNPLCQMLDGRTYYSVDLLTGGENEEGMTNYAHWSISFDNGVMSSYQSDYIVEANYSCEEDELIVDMGGEEPSIFFNDDYSEMTAGILSSTEYTYQYFPASDRSVCENVAGRLYSTGGIEGQAERPEEGPTYIDFADDYRTLQFGYGDIITSGTYDCDTGNLHIHIPGHDDYWIAELNSQNDQLTLKDGFDTQLDLQPAAPSETSE